MILFSQLLKKKNPSRQIDEYRFVWLKKLPMPILFLLMKKRIRLKIVNVPVKGFIMEDISLNACISEDMIANITLQSTYMGPEKRSIEINKLEFYYDLQGIKNIHNNRVEAPVLEIKKKEPEVCSYIGCTEMATRGRYCSFHYTWEHADSK